MGCDNSKQAPPPRPKAAATKQAPKPSAAAAPKPDPAPPAQAAPPPPPPPPVEPDMQLPDKEEDSPAPSVQSGFSPRKVEDDSVFGTTLAPVRDVNVVIQASEPLGFEMQFKVLEEEKRQQTLRISRLMKALKEKQSLEKSQVGMAQKLTKAEKKKIQEMFTRFDTDGSGQIDKEEFVNMVHELGVTLDDEDAVDAMKTISHGQSDEITLDQFVQWWAGDTKTTGKKGVALALARSRLRVLATHGTQGARERAARDQSAVKAGMNVPVDTDICVNVGKMEVPRTQVKVSVSNFGSDEFLKIADEKFINVVRPEIENADIYSKDAIENNQGPILFAEFHLELVRPCPNEKEEERFIQNLETMVRVAADTASKKIAPGWLWGEVDSSLLPEEPTVILRFALANSKWESVLARALTGSKDPAMEDLASLTSTAELELDLGVHSDVFLRNMLEEAISVFHISDEGMSMRLKGHLAPRGLSSLWALRDNVEEMAGAGGGGGGGSSSWLRRTKGVESFIANFAGVEVRLDLGNPTEVLKVAADRFMAKVREIIPPERRSDAMDDELALLHTAVVVSFTLSIEESLTLSNTRFLEWITELMSVDRSRASAMGYTDMVPIEVMFSFATFVKELKSATVWTKYQRAELEAEGLGLFSFLPCNKSEVRRFLTQRRVSRKLVSDLAAVQYSTFPLIQAEIQDHAEESEGTGRQIIIEELRSMLESIDELKQVNIKIETPG